MIKKYPREWEKVCGFPSNTHRMKVIGGWIVTDNAPPSLAMCFVPDPKHEWDLEGDE